MSTLTVDTLTNQEVQLCKAWVNFNGNGTVAIRDSFNVSSITDNAVGTYTVNFTTAMASDDYCVNCCGDFDGSSTNIVFTTPLVLAAGSVQIISHAGSVNSRHDTLQNFVSINH